MSPGGVPAVTAVEWLIASPGEALAGSLVELPAASLVELPVANLVDVLATRYNYAATFLLLAIGLYMMIADRNLVKKVIGLNVFQVAIFLFFVTSGFVRGGRPPVVHGGEPGTHASPLPHVLILTAIVVGVSLTAVALALVVRIYAEYGTLDEEVLREVRANE